jgi:H/ACA ribonucleoprotein complex subunit 3
LLVTRVKQEDRRHRRDKMYLMFYLDAAGNRQYTLSKASPQSVVCKSAHPARFSPDDKFSRHRVVLKKRCGVLPTQLPSRPL